MGHSTYKISVDSKGKAICKIGKQCGDICIPKRKKCKDTRGEAAALVKELQGVRKELSELRNELRSMRSGNNTPQKPSQELQKSLDKTSKAIANSVDISKVAAVGAIAGMSLIALPPAGYLAFRANYHNNFNKSAEEAKNIANEIKDDIPNDLKGGYKGTNGDTPANQITFVVGGFAGQGGENSLQYAQQFAPNRGSGAQNTLKQSAEDASDSPDLFEDHHVVAINNRDFEIRPSGKREKVSIPIPFTDQTITDGTTEQFKTMLETSVVKGSNPVSIELAAKAYAYRQKHPDKPINLMGYSAGGMVTHEAAHILEKMGVKDVRVANFGSPYWGLNDKVGQSVTFASENDPVVSQGGVAIRDPILVNKVANHFAYLQNPDTRRHLANFFDRSKSNVKPNQDVWVPGVTPTPKEQSSNLTPGSKPKPKEGETEAEYNARVAREKKRQRREDPAVQAELQRKMQERASRQAASKNDSFTYHLSRLDAIKKAVCKTGKQCGDRCIPKKSKCNPNSGLQQKNKPISRQEDDKNKLTKAQIAFNGQALGAIASTIGIGILFAPFIPYFQEIAKEEVDQQKQEEARVKTNQDINRKQKEAINNERNKEQERLKTQTLEEFQNDIDIYIDNRKRLRAGALSWGEDKGYTDIELIDDWYWGLPPNSSEKKPLQGYVNNYERNKKSFDRLLKSKWAKDAGVENINNIPDSAHSKNRKRSDTYDISRADTVKKALFRGK